MPFVIITEHAALRACAPRRALRIICSNEPRCSHSTTTTVYTYKKQIICFQICCPGPFSRRISCHLTPAPPTLLRPAPPPPKIASGYRPSVTSTPAGAVTFVPEALVRRPSPLLVALYAPDGDQNPGVASSLPEVLVLPLLMEPPLNPVAFLV